MKYHAETCRGLTQDCTCMPVDLEAHFNARREVIATAVFAALLASPKEIRYNGQAIASTADHSRVYAGMAVISADALIAELDKEQA